MTVVLLLVLMFEFVLIGFVAGSHSIDGLAFDRNQSYILSTIPSEGYMWGIAANEDAFYVTRIVSCYVYVFDSSFSVIAKYGTGSCNTYGSAVSSASFNQPTNIWVASSNEIFLVENYLIRRISSEGLVSIYAGQANEINSNNQHILGNGEPATSVALTSAVESITGDTAGNLFYADGMNCVVRKINVNGILSTYAGTGSLPAAARKSSGPATTIELLRPSAIWMNSNGFLYIAEYNTMKQIDTEGFMVDLGVSGLYAPYSLSGDTLGNVFISDSLNYVIRCLSYEEKKLSIIAGQEGKSSGATISGPATATTLSLPTGIVVDSSGVVYFPGYGRGTINRMEIPVPSATPTQHPTAPTVYPTMAPTQPSTEPTALPSKAPTMIPTLSPTAPPTDAPSALPTRSPTRLPTTRAPTTYSPSRMPTVVHDLITFTITVIYERLPSPLSALDQLAIVNAASRIMAVDRSYVFLTQLIHSTHANSFVATTVLTFLPNITSNSNLISDLSGYCQSVRDSLTDAHENDAFAVIVEDEATALGASVILRGKYDSMAVSDCIVVDTKAVSSSENSNSSAGNVSLTVCVVFLAAAVMVSLLLRYFNTRRNKVRDASQDTTIDINDLPPIIPVAEDAVLVGPVLEGRDLPVPASASVVEVRGTEPSVSVVGRSSSMRRVESWTAVEMQFNEASDEGAD